MSFKKDIQSWNKKFLAKSAVVVKDATIDMFSHMIDESPVKTGTFVGNYATNDVNAPFRPEVQNSRSGAIADMKSSMEEEYKKSQTSPSYSLSNPSPYFEKLEYGSSQQAPLGMIRKNVMLWDRYVEKAAKKNGDIK